MKFKISDKISTKKEILLYKEGDNKYFTIDISVSLKCFKTAKKVNIGDIVTCSGHTDPNTLYMIEDMDIVGK